MDAAWELGITHFDTADAYGGGRSEAAIGRWIKRPRRPPEADHEDLQPDGHRRRPRARARPHQPPVRSPASSGSGSTASSSTSRTSSTPRFRSPTRSARSRRSRPAAGSAPTASATSTPRSSRPRSQRASPQAIQNAYSLLERGDERGGAAAVRARRVAYLGVQPAVGRMADRQVPPRRAVSRRLADDPAPRALRARCSPTARSTRSTGSRRSGASAACSMAGVALAWLLADDRVTQIVVGPGRPEHLEPVREALAQPLTADEYARLEEAFRCADPQPRGRAGGARRPTSANRR